MSIEVEIYKTYSQKPEYPHHLIQRIYTEPAARDESDGWDDLSESDKPYKKFKYTIKGSRIVFIVPKTVDFEEFKRIAGKSRWFKALKKWTVLNYQQKILRIRNDYEINYINVERIIAGMLSKMEALLYGKEIIDKIREFVKRCYNGGENVQYVESDILWNGAITLYFRRIMKFEGMLLPFKVEISVRVPAECFDDKIKIPATLMIKMLKALVRDELRYWNLRTPKKEVGVPLSKFLKIVKELAKQQKLRKDWNDILLTQVNFLLRHPLYL